MRRLLGLPTAALFLVLSAILPAQEPPKPSADRLSIRPPQWPGSTSTWFSEKSDVAPIRVWHYSNDAHGRAEVARALRLLRETDMYGKFARLLSPYKPVPDTKLCQSLPLASARALCFERNGTDDCLDVYLLPQPILGFCCPALPFHSRLDQPYITPCWLIIEENQTDKNLGSELAHELFHAFQFAIDGSEPSWWIEGTATWAQDVAGPDWQTEQRAVPGAFDLDKHTLVQLTQKNFHENSAYIFPFYLASTYGQETVGDIWKKCGEGGLDIDDVLSQSGAAGRDFSEVFKEFALLNLDDSLVQQCDCTLACYRETLNTFQHHLFREITLADIPGRIELLELDPLSAIYLHIQNECDPQKTPGIRVDLEKVLTNDRISVQALIRDRNMKWTYEDWSHKKERRLCLNNEEENFSEILLVVANSDFERSSQGLELPLNVSVDGDCRAEWVGTFQMRKTVHARVSQPGEWHSRRAAPGKETGGSGTQGGTRTSTEYSCDIDISVSIPLRLDPQTAGKDDMAKLAAQFADLSGVISYSMAELQGHYSINMRQAHKLTTESRDTNSQTVTSEYRYGGPLRPIPGHLVRAPILIVDERKQEYALEIAFTFTPPCPGKSTIHTVGPRSERTVTNKIELDERIKLFDSYIIRPAWNVRALKGKVTDNTIIGEWSFPARQVDDRGLTCSVEDLDGVTIILHLIRRRNP